VYARSNTLQAQPDSVDAGIRVFEQEILPALQRMDGFVGESLLLDRETGLNIVTTAWATEQARASSADLVRPLRERAAIAMGATSAKVEDWEIAVMHRDHPSHEGACVRTTWASFDPAETDRVAAYWKQNILPGAEQLPGFCSASFLVDRAAGRSVGTVTFESRAHLDATRDASAAMRSTASSDVGVTITDVREFDLVMAHLHVPELV
jgi:hypothetical protein